MIRQELIAAGLLAPGEWQIRRVTAFPIGLRLDAAGELAAARHVREGAPERR